MLNVNIIIYNNIWEKKRKMGSLFSKTHFQVYSVTIDRPNNSNKPNVKKSGIVKIDLNERTSRNKQYHHELCNSLKHKYPLLLTKKEAERLGYVKLKSRYECDCF